MGLHIKDTAEAEEIMKTFAKTLTTIGIITRVQDIELDISKEKDDTRD